jgi:uncharacterized protein (TIGR02145 family)
MSVRKRELFINKIKKMVKSNRMQSQKQVLLAAVFFVFLFSGSAAQQAGSFTDPRDGEIYKTVTIAGQVWMADNLNFATNEGSWCYNEENSYCDIYGRLYTWNAAQEGCPRRWHVPSADEWEQLINASGGVQEAGLELKAAEGWKDSAAKGTNSSGFSALPGGARNYGAVCVRAGTHGYYWSVTEMGGGAWYFELSYDKSVINKYASNHKGPGFSVRCLKDK